jgi:hypothetical protein
MAIDKCIVRLEAMPLPPVKEHMEKFHAGAVTIGVEFRILTSELIAAWGEAANAKGEELNDAGVSLHVFVRAADGISERLRFDCFQEDPHYHYVSWADKHNYQVFLDPTVVGDPLEWALRCIRTRLTPMLVKAGVGEAAEVVDQQRIDAILPVVAAAAYRARFQVDRAAIAQGAMADIRNRPFTVANV